MFCICALLAPSAAAVAHVVPATRTAATRTAVLPDKDVALLPDGTYFNRRLGALNVFEIDVDEALIDQAADIFDRSRVDSPTFCNMGEPAEPYDDTVTPDGRFFTQRVSGWNSNIAWVAV